MLPGIETATKLRENQVREFRAAIRFARNMMQDVYDRIPDRAAGTEDATLRGEIMYHRNVLTQYLGESQS